MEKYDVCILGGGPAGLTAGIYSSRYDMKTILVTREIGGMANLAEKVENYPGFDGSGKDLMKKFYQQAKDYGAKFLNEDIIDIKKVKNEFIVTTNTIKIGVKAVIIALGLQRRKLNIPGEDKFLGKGVSYCATCDANFFKGKDVAVIGGSDSACKASLLLSGIARKVYLTYRGSELRCENIIKKKLIGKKNVEFMYDTTPFEIKGKQAVSELIVIRDGKEIPRQEKISVQGVFIEIGGLPASDIAKMLRVKLDKEEHIIVDKDMSTNIPGVFAAGDIVKSKLKQIIVAASQGAIAAKSTHEYLKEK